MLKQKKALKDSGCDLKDMVRTRFILKNISDWKNIVLVHAEYFNNIKPATTTMETSRFINPEWLIEIEVDTSIACNNK